jgi:hypothetical protein
MPSSVRVLHEGCGWGRIWVDGRGLLVRTGNIDYRATDHPTVVQVVCACGWAMWARVLGSRN